jgi:AmpE protein
MTLLALLIGLIIERIATQLFHLRRLRWLDRLIDSGFQLGERFAAWPALVPVVLLVLVLIAPVFAALFYLWDESYGIEDLLFAVFVLFFSLGPQDIGEDVAEYCRAVEADDEGRIQHTSKALIEQDPPAEPLARIHAVEESVCVQANNRLFAVVFWFVAFGSFGPFGPLAAWTYRVTDLIRRRAVFNASRDGNACEALLSAAVMLHGWLIWIPARLTAIGYAMAGSFDAALSAWRHPQKVDNGSVHGKSERLLARVGIGALALSDIDDESLSDRGVRGAMAANGLVYRLFFIWVFVIGWMTLYGLSQ